MCSHIFAVVLTASRELLRASTFILYLFEAVVALLVLDNWTVTSAIKATPAASASATKISAIGAFTSLLAFLTLSTLSALIRLLLLAFLSRHLG